MNGCGLSTDRNSCSATQSRPWALCTRSCACCQQGFGTAVPRTAVIPTRLFSRGATWLSASAAKGKVCGPRGGTVRLEEFGCTPAVTVAVVQAPRSRQPRHDAERGCPHFSKTVLACRGHQPRLQTLLELDEQDGALTGGPDEYGSNESLSPIRCERNSLLAFLPSSMPRHIPS